MRKFLPFLLLLGACRSLPQGAVLDELHNLTTVPGSYPIAQPDSAEAARARLDSCVQANRTTPGPRIPSVQLKDIHWRAIDTSSFSMIGETNLAGWSNLFFHDITIASPYRDNVTLLEHELLHSQFLIFGHPEPFTKCNLMTPIPFQKGQDASGISSPA